MKNDADDAVCFSGLSQDRFEQKRSVETCFALLSRCIFPFYPHDVHNVLRVFTIKLGLLLPVTSRPFPRIAYELFSSSTGKKFVVEHSLDLTRQEKFSHPTRILIDRVYFSKDVIYIFGFEPLVFS